MNTPRQIVHIVDDDPSFRRSLSVLLQAAGYEVRGYASAAECLAADVANSAGCVLADMRMPGKSGLELQDSLGGTDSEIPVIILTGYGDIPTTVSAMRRGAVDFLTKPVDRDELFAAVERGFARNAASREERDRLQALRNRYGTLTPRERQVLTHVIAGKLNKQIAFEFGTGERTVKAHRANVMKKLRVRSVAELVRLAELLGIRPAD